nr:hypothetical protein [Tanacetum cinerariifolium]
MKPASSMIKRVYMLSLRERMELDLEARLMEETLVLNRSLDLLYGDNIKLNDLNVHDLIPTIEEGEVIDEPMIDIFKTTYNESFDEDGYRDQDMGDIIFREPFCKASCVEARRTYYEPVEYRSRLLHYLDELEKLLKDRTLKDGELQLKEKAVKAIKEIENDGSLVTKGTSLAQKYECSTSGNDSSNSQPSSDINTTSKVHRDTFDNLFAEKVKHDVLQANVLLTNKLENVFVNDKVFVNESEYYKMIKLLKEEITNLKSQAYQKKRHFPVRTKSMMRQTDQTLCMVLPSEDMVKMGRQGLGFDDHNDVVNPSLLDKAKELVPNLYNAKKIGTDLPSDHKIISEDELKCENEKCLNVKHYKSPLSYHGFVYGETHIAILELQLAHKTDDFKAEKERFLKQIAALESKLAS